MKRILVATTLSLLLAGLLLGEEVRGSISGVVTDGTGSLVAGASITVTETNTATKLETRTDTSGHYNVPLLLPGDYEVSVKMDGFKEFIRRSLHLGAGETPTVDA